MEISLEWFISMLPRRPYCADELKYSVIRDAKIAIKRKYIQVNHPMWKRFIVIDVDHSDLDITTTNKIPIPTFKVINPKNSHSHYIYALNIPVVKGNPKSYKYYQAIQRGVTKKLKGDENYFGVLVKNPFHPFWITESNNIFYNLADLDKYLTYQDKKIDFNKITNIDINTIKDGNRHTSYFWLARTESLRYLNQNPQCSYNELFDFTKMILEKLNLKIEVNGIEKLPQSEVLGIASSITGYLHKHKNNIIGKNIRLKNIGVCKGTIQETMTVKEKQRVGGLYTSEKKKEKSSKANIAIEKKIIEEIQKYLERGKNPNRSEIARKVGINRQQIYRSFKHLFKMNIY